MRQLLRALLENPVQHQSAVVQRYLSALEKYVFAKRRREISYRKNLRHLYMYVSEQDLEALRTVAHDLERLVVDEIGPEEVQKLKRFVGRRLTFRSLRDKFWGPENASTTVASRLAVQGDVPFDSWRYS